MEFYRPPFALRKNSNCSFLPEYSKSIERGFWCLNFYYFLNGAISASQVYSIKMVRVNSAEERNPTHQEFPRTLSVVMRIVLCGEDLVGNRCAQLCPRLLSCCQTETVLPSASTVPPHLSTSQTLTSSPVALMMKPLRTISGNLKDAWLTVICS